MVKIFGWIPKPGTSPRGSGKTGGMVWHLNQRKLAGRKIFTNFPTTFTDEIISANKLKMMPEDMRDCAIGATEVHQFLESRRSQKGEQIKITYTILMLRKLRAEFHWDSQAVHQVEKRLVEQTDVIIHCDNLGCREMECKNRSCGIPTCGIFHYEMYDGHTSQFMGEFWLNGEHDFYHHFDSEGLVKDFVSDETEDDDD